MGAPFVFKDLRSITPKRRFSPDKVLASGRDYPLALHVLKAFRCGGWPSDLASSVADAFD
jgi:hypothetical protein